MHSGSVFDSVFGSVFDSVFRSVFGNEQGINRYLDSSAGADFRQTIAKRANANAKVRSLRPIYLTRISARGRNDARWRDRSSDGENRLFAARFVPIASRNKFHSLYLYTRALSYRRDYRLYTRTRSRLSSFSRGARDDTGGQTREKGRDVLFSVCLVTHCSRDSTARDDIGENTPSGLKRASIFSKRDRSSEKRTCEAHLVSSTSGIPSRSRHSISTLAPSARSLSSALRTAE